MENFIVIISLTISAVGILCSCVVLWQYFTGRPYWGEHNENIQLALISSIIPMLNLIIYGFVAVLYSVAYIITFSWDQRKKAVKRYDSKKKSSERKSED